MKVTALHKQSLLDIVLQVTGITDSLVSVAEFNGISPTDDVMPGQNILMPKDAKIDKEILNYYKAKDIKPATALSDEDKRISDKPSGISHWAISVDFEVQ